MIRYDHDMKRKLLCLLLMMGMSELDLILGNGRRAMAADQPTPMLRFNVIDEHGRSDQLCLGALVWKKQSTTDGRYFGFIGTAKECWHIIRDKMKTMKKGNWIPELEAQSATHSYLVTGVIETVPTPGNDPTMDEAAKEIVLMTVEGDIEELSFIYDFNRIHVESLVSAGTPILMGDTSSTTEGRWSGTSYPVGLAGGVTDPWNKPLFPVVLVQFNTHQLGAPFYVKDRSLIRYILGILINKDQCVNAKKLLDYCQLRQQKHLTSTPIRHFL